MKGKFLKEKNVRLRQICQEQEIEMEENDEMLEQMNQCENK